MTIPPWLSALGILLLACVVGSIIVKSHKEFDGFYDASSRAALRACERTLQTCLNDGNPLAGCTTTYNGCVAAVNNPSVSTATPARSTGTSLQSAQGAASQDRITEASGTAGNAASADYNALATQALAGQQQTLTPGLAAFLRQIQTAAQNPVSDPTAAQLSDIQGTDLGLPYAIPNLGIDISGSEYQSPQQRIFPHQTPQRIVSQTVPVAPTDRGTQAETIATQMIAPSLRSQIRNDVQQAVRDELSNIRNNYEIQYVSNE